MEPGVEVEWLILADGAQVMNGKLYLIGGGWDSLFVNDQLPRNQHLAIAASFMVPWGETNHPHNIEIAIVADQGGRELMKVAGKIEVGRPPGILQGQDQRAPIAVEAVVELDAGTYFIVARVEGSHEKRVAFRVIPGPGLAGKHRQG